MILLIDNYDSFSYNLYQLIGEMNPNIEVYRNDALTLEEIKSLSPEKIVLSPGPGRPENAGITPLVPKEFGERIPVLGVCLGHQAICYAFGGKITYAPRLMHGKSSWADLSPSCPIFKGCSRRERVGRYHSLILDPETLPNDLTVTARTDEGEIMGVMHREYPIYGLQFHPESVLTPCGATILKNFINL